MFFLSDATQEAEFLRTLCPPPLHRMVLQLPSAQSAVCGFTSNSVSTHASTLLVLLLLSYVASTNYLLASTSYFSAF